MRAFAILGAHPAISLAEITETTQRNPVIAQETFAIFSEPWSDAQVPMRLLGGTQKLGRIETTLPLGIAQKDLHAGLLALLLALPAQKVQFGISVYGTKKETDRIGSMLAGLGIELKRALAGQGRSARVVSTKGCALPAASILANKLITKGGEIVILATEHELLVGFTEAVQDIDAWVLRDRGRPRTNAKQGMLPPKLARIMLNLVGTSSEGKTVCDPFCGSGTVLMEAGVLGAHRLIGGDQNPMAITDTEENMVWAQSTLNVHAHYTLFPSVASELHKHIPPASVDIIVTEPYLGRPRKGIETAEDLEETVAYLTRLYKESFLGLRGILKPGARVLIASPVHLLEDRNYPVPTEALMQEIGFTSLPFNEPLVYHHEGQFVARELLRFSR